MAFLNKSLIHDIICFAITVYDKDCYFVFGVSDDYPEMGMARFKKKL